MRFLLFVGLLIALVCPARAAAPDGTQSVTATEKLAAQSAVSAFFGAIARGDADAAKRLCADTPDIATVLKSELNLGRINPGTRLSRLRFSRWNWHQSQLGFPVLGVRLDADRTWRVGKRRTEIDVLYLLEFQPDGEKFRLARRIWRTTPLLNTLGRSDDSLERSAIIREEQIGNILRLSPLSAAQNADFLALATRYARAVVARDEKSALDLATAANRDSLRAYFRSQLNHGTHRLREVRLIFPRFRVWNGQSVARARVLVGWNQKFAGVSQAETQTLLLEARQTPQGLRLSDQFSYLDHDAALSRGSTEMRGAIYLDDFEAKLAIFPRPVPATTKKAIQSDISAMLAAHLAQNEAKVRSSWLTARQDSEIESVIRSMRSDAKTNMESVSATRFGRWSMEQDETGPLIRVRVFVRWDWHKDGKPDWNERFWIFTLRPVEKTWKIAARLRRSESISAAFRGVESAESRAIIARDEHYGEARRAANRAETAIARDFLSDLLDSLRRGDREKLATLCLPDSPAFDTLDDNLSDKEMRVVMASLGAMKMGKAESVTRDGKTWLEARAVAPMTVQGGASDYVFIAKIERDSAKDGAKDGAVWRARRAFWRDDDLFASLGANGIAQSAYLLDLERETWNVGFYRRLMAASDRAALQNEGGAKALHWCETGLQLAAFLGDGDLLGDAYTRRGGLLAGNFKGQKAGESAGETDDYRQSLNNWRAVGNRPLIGFGLHRLGQQASGVADYGLAEKFELAALSHARRCADTVTQTLALQSLGGIYGELNQDARGASFYERARDLAAREGYSSYQIDALINLGAWHFNRGEISRGLGALGQALQLARRDDLKEAQIEALRALAQGAVITGQWNEAISRLQSARALAKNLEDPALEFSILQNLRTAHGERYLEAGAPAETDLKGTASADFREVGVLTADLSELQELLPVSLSNESMVAASFLRDTDWNLSAAAMVSPARARVFVAGEEDSLDRMEKYARKRKQPARIAKTQLLRGELFRLQGRFAEGIASLEAARLYYEQGSDNLIPLATLHRFEGDNWRDQKEWQRAADAYRASIAITEKQRAGAGDAGLQSGLLAGNVASYQRLAECLLRLGADPNQILGAVEAARARALVELMQRGGAGDFAPKTANSLSVEQKNRERELRLTVALFQKRLDALASGEESGQASEAAAKSLALARAAAGLGASEGFGGAQTALTPDALRAKLQNARLELDAFERDSNARATKTNAKSAVDVPASAPAPWQAPPASQLEKLFANHPKRRVLLFQVGDNSTLLLVLSGAGGAVKTQTFEILVSRLALRAQVEAARRSWARPSSIADDNSELQTLLLGPAQSALKGASELIIIPDDSLAALPFAALNDENGDFLIQKFAISYAPGLTALGEMEKRAATLKTAKKDARVPFLGISRSDFAEIGLKALPGTRAEVAAIAPLFGQAARVAQGANATKAFARRELPRARFVHLATHGLLNEAAPLYSSVALSPDPTDPDGRLYARDLMAIKLSADLVVLSACETALGQEVRGEGVLGLTWALFVAGTPTSVVTQWNVDDAATSALMPNFYAAMQTGQTPAAALRAAQLGLLKGKTTRHPAYWAPFIVVGASG